MTVACHFQVTLLSIHRWLLFPLASPMRISLQELSDVDVRPVHMFCVYCLMAGLAREPNPGAIMTYCTIRKPFIWHRDVVSSTLVKFELLHLEKSDDYLWRSVNVSVEVQLRR